jgi:alkaline phosphatase D
MRSPSPCARGSGGGVSRRSLLATAAIVPLASLAGCVSSGLPSGLFTLGVASGEPTASGVVLWTRLAPEAGMPEAPVEVAWSVARDEAFAQIVQRGTALATAEDAHSVHVEVDGLEPGRPYWYRFVTNGESTQGRTRTAPLTTDRLRLAYASCQHYEQGFYAAHRHLAAEELDLVLFLGDYIYEASTARQAVRSHNAPEAVTLADYRNRYALYKRDRDLQAAHAAHPWVVTWDDHEVSNDYANDRGERQAGADYLARRAAAYKAFWEHMPLRPAQRPSAASLPLYRQLDFGDLARIVVLDDRQYRDAIACPRPNLIGGSNFVTDAQCPERLDPRRSLLGPEQERWLEATLARPAARWHLIAQQTLMAQCLRPPERRYWTDGWDGYPQARRRLLELLARRERNLVIGGDVHATYVADLKPDFDDPRSPVVASEICGTSITSQGPTREDTARRMADNPHISFADGTTRGYMRLELTRARATADLRGLADVRQVHSAIATRASFVIDADRAGALRA